MKLTRQTVRVRRRDDADDARREAAPATRALGLVVLALVLANLLYFAWSHGGLRVFGTVPAGLAERDSHRLAQQVRPEVLRILKDEPNPAPTPSPNVTPAAAVRR